MKFHSVQNLGSPPVSWCFTLWEEHVSRLWCFRTGCCGLCYHFSFSAEVSELWALQVWPVPGINRCQLQPEEVQWSWIVWKVSSDIATGAPTFSGAICKDETLVRLGDLIASVCGSVS